MSIYLSKGKILIKIKLLWMTTPKRKRMLKIVNNKSECCWKKPKASSRIVFQNANRSVALLQFSLRKSQRSPLLFFQSWWCHMNRQSHLWNIRFINVKFCYRNWKPIPSTLWKEGMNRLRTLTCWKQSKHMIFIPRFQRDAGKRSSIWRLTERT